MVPTITKIILPKKYCNEFEKNQLDSGQKVRMMPFPQNISHPPASLGIVLFLVANDSECHLISSHKRLSQLHHSLLNVISILPAKKQIFSPIEAMDENHQLYFTSTLSCVRFPSLPSRRIPM